MVVPIILTMALTIAEFGVAFGTNMTMIEATRSGARVGAILVDGTDSLGCPGYVGATNVDPQIVAAVQRTIESPNSGIAIANVDWIHIYQADVNGNPVAGTINEWKVASTSGGGPLVCGVHLDFIASPVNWPASGRTNVLPANSIGVSVQYRYKMFTPLASLTGLFGLSTITMVDSTVMAFEP